VSESPEVTTYGLAPQLRARLMAAALMALGLLLAGLTVVVLVAGLTLDVVAVAVVLVLLVVFGLGHLLVRRWYVVRLDPVGYQVRFVRGAGVKAARWTDVEDLVTATVTGARCAVLRLRDGRTTTVPVDVVQGTGEAFVEELRRRLEAGHGYRRLR
jgi:hypothetical protein